MDLRKFPRGHLRKGTSCEKYRQDDKERPVGDELFHLFGKTGSRQQAIGSSMGGGSGSCFSFFLNLLIVF